MRWAVSVQQSCHRVLLQLQGAEGRNVRKHKKVCPTGVRAVQEHGGPCSACCRGRRFHARDTRRALAARGCPFRGACYCGPACHPPHHNHQHVTAHSCGKCRTSVGYPAGECWPSHLGPCRQVAPEQRQPQVEYAANRRTACRSIAHHSSPARHLPRRHLWYMGSQHAAPVLRWPKGDCPVQGHLCMASDPKLFVGSRPLVPCSPI